VSVTFFGALSGSSFFQKDDIHSGPRDASALPCRRLFLEEKEKTYHKSSDFFPLLKRFAFGRAGDVF
jgi:hypothetical protein